jgi:Uma2 family endonuclease
MNTAMRRDGFIYMSLDDFEERLADKPANEKWELIGGRLVRMMVGARWEHKRIVQNITASLLATFRERKSGCRPYDETFFLKKPELASAVLPDVMVRCGPLAPGATFLDDPVVVFEVLSDGSERRDRTEKWTIYRQLPSLRHYVLVDRDSPVVEVRSRRGDEWSELRVLDRLEATVDLPAIDISLPLAVIYEDVASAEWP